MTESNDEILGLLAETSLCTATIARRSRRTGATAVRPAGGRIESLGVAYAPIRRGVRTDRRRIQIVLADADGGAVVEPYGWSVTQLVAHLLEVDLYFGRQLGLWDHTIDDSLEDDHLA